MPDQKPALTSLYDLVTGDEDARVCKDIPDSACDEQPYNFFQHLAGNVLSKLADELASARLVFPWILALLGAPLAIISMAVPIREAGVLFPQLFVAARIRSMPIRKTAWALGAWLTAVALAICGFVVLLGPQNNGNSLAYWVVLLMLIVYALARGICSVAQKDVLGKTVSKSRRGTLTGIATSISGLITLCAGLAMAFMDVRDAGHHVFAALFFAGALCWLFTGACIVSLREVPGATSGGANAGAQALASLNILHTDPPFRRFVWVRGLLLSVSLGLPIVAVMAQSELSSSSVLGLLIAVGGAANWVSGYFWGRFADWSSRHLMAVAAGLNGVFSLGLVALILIAPQLASHAWLYLAAYFVLSVCLAGERIGRKTELLDMASPENRAQYVAVSNTVIGVAVLALGALTGIASQGNAPALLALLASISLLAAALALRLRNNQAFD